MLEESTKSMALQIIDKSNTIIFGSHAQLKEYKFTYKLSNTECMVISAKGFYMHPSTEYFYKDKVIYKLPERVDFIR